MIVKLKRYYSATIDFHKKCQSEDVPIQSSVWLKFSEAFDKDMKVQNKNFTIRLILNLYKYSFE